MKSLISRRRGKLGNRYHIRGTRLQMVLIKALVNDGCTVEQIMRWYPYPEVTPASIAACAAFMTPSPTTDDARMEGE